MNSKLFFISVMLWKKLIKKCQKKISRDFFSLKISCTKKITYNERKLKKAPYYHKFPRVAQFFDYFRVFYLYFPTCPHTEKNSYPKFSNHPWKKEKFITKPYVFDWVLLCERSIIETKIHENQKLTKFIRSN